MQIRILATGGTFDKEYNELTGELFFKETHTGDMLRLVVGNGMKLVAIGLVAGLAGAFWLTRYMSALLYGVKPSDPLTYVEVASVLLAVAFLATYIPARRAAQVDPVIALRYE